MEPLRRFIVDVDAGVDDYQTLLILLHADRQGQLKVEAITCTTGNTSMKNVVKNVFRLLELLGRTDVPVYLGAEEPLILPDEPYLDQFHGKDGFGGLKHDCEPDTSKVNVTPSAIAMAEIARKYRNQIELICVAPLTNVALALKLYPDFYKDVAKVWIMGGNSAGEGNITPAAEFNFFVDPEAAHIVLECFKCPIIILPWETCKRSTIPLKWRYTALNEESPVIQLLTRAERSIYPPSKTNWSPCDALLAWAALDFEENVKNSTRCHASVELHGNRTRGMMIIDHKYQKPTNVQIINTIHEDRFQKYTVEMSNAFANQRK